MADEKLNTGPAENISPEAAEPITTPEQATASEPQQEQTGPAIPESGDVVVSFDKINELMSNRLLPYDTIIKAHEGDPIAIQAVLDRYAGYIRYFSKMNGYYNSDMEDYIRTKLIESLFKFRLDR